MYLSNCFDYELMMQEKFGKDLTPHRVKEISNVEKVALANHPLNKRDWFYQSLLKIQCKFGTSVADISQLI